MWQPTQLCAIGSLWKKHHEEFYPLMESSGAKTILEIGGVIVTSLQFTQRETLAARIVVEPNISDQIRTSSDLPEQILVEGWLMTLQLT